MKTFNIEIKEVLSRIVQVKADTEIEAVSKIEEQYKNANIVLDYNDFVSVDFFDIDTIEYNNEKDILMNEIIEYLYSIEKKYYKELYESESQIYKKIEKLKKILY